MKIPLGVMLILSAAADFGGNAAAPPCNTSGLSQLVVNSNVRTCRSDSGYNPASMGPATDAQVTAVCSSNACTQALNDLKQVAPNECTIGPVRLYADAIDPLERRCGRNAGSASANGSVGDVGSKSASGSVVGSAISSASAGSTTKSPATSAPPTASPRSGSPSTAPGNGATSTSSLPAFAAVAVLATVVAAIS
ncbi:hypothetical protein PHYPSEUDO_007895 [Phytophthora pseudosyringae]|uniref:Elicitin n=1 Tax=Phytophthora pseudosyringae TaxID=221518 RepID=A0A8T1VGB3_9STRA|nr:hypothetical protein PHYPSEUDO_007895 [Phytophthora pseudosyringae]